MQVFFDKTLANEFAKVYSKFKKIELGADEKYKKDLTYITNKIQILEPLESVCEKENFNVAAIDGSGAENLVSLNDISIHLMTASFASDRTSFEQGTTKQIQMNPALCSHPDGVIRLTLLREDKEAEVWDEFLNYIHYNYGEELKPIVFRVLKEIVSEEFLKKNPKTPLPKLDNEMDIRKTAIKVGLNLHPDKFDSFSTWMVSPRGRATRGWFEQFREILEYALAHALIKSNTHFKYLFLDGSLNMLLSPGQKQPRLASNYLLRDLSSKSYNQDTCVVAVSKTTTFPFIYRIADDLEKELGSEKKWFLRVPTMDYDGHILNILADRPHIPPAFAVTYLFHFSSEVPVLRIDFDEKWWRNKIYSPNKKVEKQNELELFQEIDWLARDVRYYGYFFDLAFAHTSTIVKFTDRDVVADQLIDYFVINGENPKMFIHPRKRLGLL